MDHFHKGCKMFQQNIQDAWYDHLSMKPQSGQSFSIDISATFLRLMKPPSNTPQAKLACPKGFLWCPHTNIGLGLALRLTQNFQVRSQQPYIILVTSCLLMILVVYPVPPCNFQQTLGIKNWKHNFC